MICSRCGQNISGDSIVCRYCGAPVQVRGQNYQDEQPASPQH